MRDQRGFSTVGVGAVIAVLAICGTGLLAWQKMSEAERLRGELTTTRAALDKARFDLKKSAQDVAAAGKETAALKVAAERLTAERDAVRSSMETEQATGVKLREELAIANAQISYLTARTSKEVVRGMPKSVR